MSLRLMLGLAAVAAAMLATALPAAAKEGARATLTTAVPLDAAAGARLKVGWTLAYRDEHGKRRPFGANGVFVRLLSASGAPAETGVAPSGAYAKGRYSATVVVPKGGIGDVEIGLHGFTSGATGYRQADVLFPITNDPLPGALRITASGGGPSTWEYAVFATALTALAVVSVALVRRGGALSLRRRRQSVDRA